MAYPAAVAQTAPAYAAPAPAPAQATAGVPPMALALGLIAAGIVVALAFTLAGTWLIDTIYGNFTAPLNFLVDFGLLALVLPLCSALLGLLVAGRRSGDADADRWTLIASIAVPVVYLGVIAWASRAEDPGTLGYLFATTAWRWALLSDSLSGWAGVGAVAVVAAAGVGVYWLMRKRGTLKGTALVVPGALITVIGGSALYYMVLVQLDKIVRLWGWGE